MAGFGGAVKLTGESEYKKALIQITQNLKELSAESKKVASAYSTNDKSMEATNAKTKVLNSTLTEQENKLKALKAQYNSYSQEMAKNQAKHDALVNKLQSERTTLDNLKNTLGENSSEYQEQADKVKELEKAVLKSSQAQEKNAKTMSNMRVQISNAETDINKTTNELKKLENSENKAGDEAEDLGTKSKKASKSVDDLGSSSNSTSSLVSNLGSALKTAGKLAIAGVGTLSAGVLAIGKSAIESYAEYEQLVGGVDTLFKNSSKTVQKYADDAYKTASMSANQYMETVTSFSASLIQGLNGDTAKASKIANMAIIDMSDNANKMGTSMELIQNAYQGFAKQNYTMLDNLKLGYGGTKSEMARLIKDSGVLGKAGEDLTAKNLDQKVSFDKIVEAIHKVQSNMGITGTTAKEAGSTIEGSVNSMRSAWQNLVTGMASDNKDMDKLVNNFVDSVESVVDNVLPVIERTAPAIISGMSKVITKVKPKLTEAVEKIKPVLLNTVQSTIKAMGSIIYALVPNEVQKPLEMVASGFKWLIDNKELVISAVAGMVTAFAVVKIANFALAFKETIDVIKSAPTIIEGASNALKILNITASANPYVLLAGAIAGVVTALGVFAFQSKETTEQVDAEMEKAKEHKKAIEEETKAYNDLIAKRDEMVSSGASEIDYATRLWTELDKLIGKNGEVKKGYEDRAKFIAGELKDKLGIEIDTTKNLRKQYDNLGKSIEDVVKKKKAQIIMDSNADLYKTAITKQDKAYKDLSKFEDEFNKQQKKVDDLNKQHDELLKKASETFGTASYNQYAYQAMEIEAQLKTSEETLKIKEKNYNDQIALVDKYNYTISQYNANEVAMAQGKYDQISTIDYETAQSYAKTGDAKKAQLEAQLKTEEEHLASLKRLKKNGNDNITNEEIQAQQTIVNNLKSNLDNYNNTVATETAKTAGLWDKSLTNDINTITGKNVVFMKTADGNVQAYIDGVKTGQPVAESEMTNFITGVINKVKNGKTDATKAGKDILDGINNGISDNSKKNTVFSSIASFGNAIIAKLKASVDAHSPSKDAEKVGGYIIDGVKVGVQNRSKQNSVFSSIANFGNSLLNKLKSTLKIHSPSLATAEMGKFLVQGLTKGMKSESKNAKADINTFSKEFLKMLKGNPESYTEAGKEIINSFNDGVKDAITKTKDKVSSTVENYFTNLEKDNEKAQENLQKQIDKTTNKTKKKKLQSQLNDLKEQNKQIKELYSKFGKDVISEFGKAMESATNGVTTKLTKNIENLTKKMQSEIDAVENAIDSMRNKLTDYGELYTTYTDKDTGAEIVHLSDIKKQTEALNKYYSNLTKLKGKVSEELLTEITNMSVEDATKFSNTLLALDKSELQAYDKAYKEKLAVADKISKQFYASKLNDIKVNYTDKIKAEFNNAKKEIKKIGEQTMQGFIDGMNSKNYTGAVKTMADNIIKQMKKSLGIHSPSKVFMELGDYSAQGYGQGFTKEMKTVIADMKNAVIPDFSNETVETLNNTPSTSQLDLISAFKEALSQMKIELDDDEVGSFVEKTVANAIYT